MFSARNFIAPIARTSFRPRVIQAPANAQIASLRARIAALSTVSEPVIHDHKELSQYYNEVINNPYDHDHQERYGNQFTWELARHSIAEELVVYPAFEKYLGEEGKRMADSDRKQHHKVRVEPSRLRAVRLISAGQRTPQDVPKYATFAPQIYSRTQKALRSSRGSHQRRRERRSTEI